MRKNESKKTPKPISQKKKKMQKRSKQNVLIGFVLFLLLLAILWTVKISKNIRYIDEFLATQQKYATDNNAFNFKKVELK